MEAGEGGEGIESPALAYGGGGGGGRQGGDEYAAAGYPNYGGDGHQVHGGEAPAAGAAVAFPTSVYRESLGFLRARRKLTLPGVGLQPGEVDDGNLAALAVMERFGFLLVSCSTGESAQEQWTIIIIPISILLLRQLQARSNAPGSRLGREHEVLRGAIDVVDRPSLHCLPYPLVGLLLVPLQPVVFLALTRHGHAT